MSNAGSLLDRSLADTAVATPECLIFEAAPTVGPPLVQDKVERQAKVISLDGTSMPGVIGSDGAVDTRRAIQPLTSEELGKKSEVMTGARRATEPAASRARAAFAATREKEAIARGVPPATAKRAAQLWAERILLPDVEFVFDDKSLGTQGLLLLRDLLKDQAAYPRVLLRGGDLLTTMAAAQLLPKAAFD